MKIFFLFYFVLGLSLLGSCSLEKDNKKEVRRGPRNIINSNTPPVVHLPAEESDQAPTVGSNQAPAKESVQSSDDNQAQSTATREGNAPAQNRQANELGVYICTQAEGDRRIVYELHKPGRTKDRLCEILQPNTEEALWYANNEADFCEIKMDQILDVHTKEEGFVCSALHTNPTN